MTSDQQRDDRGKERWLFLGSGLVIVVAMLVGLAREQRWGESMVRLRLISSNATGLRPGQEVRISGMPVGQVQRLKLQPDAAVAVEVEVANRYAALIGPNSIARQAQEGLVGDHFLEISADLKQGSKRNPLNGAVIRYEQPLELAALVQQLVQTQRELQATLRNTTKLTANDLPDTLREARSSLGGMNNLVATLQRESASTAPDLRQALRQISRTGSNAEQTSTQAQQLMRVSQPLLIRTLEDLHQTTMSVQRFLNLLGISGRDPGNGHDDAPYKPPSP
jgi:ABC-type transporter Mla subunit MlaD